MKLALVREQACSTPPFRCRLLEGDPDYAMINEDIGRDPHHPRVPLGESFEDAAAILEGFRDGTWGFRIYGMTYRQALMLIEECGYEVPDEIKKSAMDRQEVCTFRAVNMESKDALRLYELGKSLYWN